ncbi:SRPBCC family protein [Intrasporangium sp. YIM S08009]|uniref:SRPBCC family protein n=1 Tax=Intrasporangium zincisolvens TaxID=3080018 RepID=UPI002B05E838|nr:SRPBCC family protein [Intrasporangium sp. YIM S08009]
MMRLRLTATGDAAPEVVWERYRDLRLWPTWSPQVRGVDAPADLLATGLRGVVVGPVGARLPFEVLDVDEAAMSWRWRVRAGFVDAVLDHAVRPAPRGTTTDLVVTAPSVFALGYAPVARLALHRLVRA